MGSFVFVEGKVVMVKGLLLSPSSSLVLRCLGGLPRGGNVAGTWGQQRVRIAGCSIHLSLVLYLVLLLGFYAVVCRTCSSPSL